MNGEKRRGRHAARERFFPWAGEGGSIHRAPFSTDEEQKRDEMITGLLGIYVDAYESKVEENKGYRKQIFGVCIRIVSLFAVILAAMPFLALSGEMGMEDVVAFVTACVSFLALIIGLLHIVTEYVFPKDNERYITDIVKAIQENDLENRKETAKYDRIDRESAEVPDEESIELAPIRVTEDELAEL